MTPQKFILRNRETGKVWELDDWWTTDPDVGTATVNSCSVDLDCASIYPAETYELIPVGYVPLSAVREMLWHVLEVLKLNGPSSPCRATLMEDLDQLAKQYGGE